MREDGVWQGPGHCPHCGAGDGDECDFINVPHDDKEKL